MRRPSPPPCRVRSPIVQRKGGNDSPEVFPFEVEALCGKWFTQGAVLGRGSYGVVYAATPTAQGSATFGNKKFVVKCIPLKCTDRAAAAAHNEVSLLLSVTQHPHVISVLHAWIEQGGGCYPHAGVKDKTLCIAMELADGGDLDGLMNRVRAKTRRAPLNDDVCSWVMQCILALKHCHAAGIIHRDIKPQNILLVSTNQKSGTATRGKRMIIKMADFGLARHLPDGEFARTYVGTPYFISPEIVFRQPYTASTDIWSLGVCLYEWMTTKMPFRGKTLNELTVAILYAPMPDMEAQILAAHGGVNPYQRELVELCRSMLQRDAALRPSAAEMARLPWLDSWKAHVAELYPREQSRPPLAVQQKRGSTPPPPPTSCAVHPANIKARIPSSPTLYSPARVRRSPVRCITPVVQVPTTGEPEKLHIPVQVWKVHHAFEKKENAGPSHPARPPKPTTRVVSPIARQTPKSPVSRPSERPKTPPKQFKK